MADVEMKEANKPEEKKNEEAPRPRTEHQSGGAVVGARTWVWRQGTLYHSHGQQQQTTTNIRLQNSQGRDAGVHR